eukprot:3183860-Pyramimonas_sp.AAC.1
MGLTTTERCNVALNPPPRGLDMMLLHVGVSAMFRWESLPSATSPRGGPECRFCGMSASACGMARYSRAAQASPPRWGLRPAHQMRGLIWRVRRLGGVGLGDLLEKWPPARKGHWRRDHLGVI